MPTRLKALMIAGLFATAVVAAEPTSRTYEIRPQPVSTALKAFAAQSDMQLIFTEADVGEATTPGVKGELAPREALQEILKGTGLQFEFTANNVVVVRKAGPVSRREAQAVNQLAGNQPTANAMHLAQTDGASGISGSAQGAGESRQEEGSDAGSGRDEVEEIVVTAQKREERLQDVPVPVTALNADELAEQNLLLLRDYYTQVPGLNMTPSIQSIQTLAIRGITTGIGNPTVGVVVDDVPYNASTNIGGGRVVPDIDPSDLERIEVLRGPQGTLYGANSLGGLLKFVTRDPSTDGTSGRVQVGTSSVSNGDDFGYQVRGSVNLAMSDSFAIRASAFTRLDPGYIDDPGRGIEDVNETQVNGGRISALWRASDTVSLKLAALLQESEGDGANSVDPVLGDWQQNRVRGSGGYDRKSRAFNATFKGQLGSADLTSISGYAINSFTDALDFGFAQSANALALFGVPGATLNTVNEAKKLSQELRLSTPLGHKFDWLVGAFYTDEDSSLVQNTLAIDPATGSVAGRILFANQPSAFEEYAAFTDLTFHATDRFDIQVGGRQTHIRQVFSQNNINSAGVPSVVVPESFAKADAFTYLVTPQFRIAPGRMLYARLASGYRAGGLNPFPGGVVPPQYDPDETRNYEIGFKGDFLDRRFSLDASLYHIDWKDIQLALISPAATSYTTNAGTARSRGVELSMDARPLAGLSIAGWVVWNDAELTEDFPAGSPVQGLEGFRLPNTSRISGNLSVEHSFPLANGLTGFVGGSASYMGDRLSVFRPLAAPQRERYPSYTKTDLRAGLRKGDWSADFFVTNLTDERGVLYGGRGANPPTAFGYIQPRTIGLSLARSF